MMLQETDFNILSVATLRMEMNAELEIRQEEFNYYAKKLRLCTMEAVISKGDIELTFSDDKKLEAKIAEYIAKDYSLKRIMEQVPRSWKTAVVEHFNLAV